MSHACLTVVGDSWKSEEPRLDRGGMRSQQKLRWIIENPYLKVKPSGVSHTAYEDQTKYGLKAALHPCPDCQRSSPSARPGYQ